MPGPLESKSLFCYPEIARRREELPVVYLFDLSIPAERKRLNSHLIWEAVEMEEKFFPVLFWTERNEKNEIISLQQIEIRDIVDSQLERLFLIQNPNLLFKYKGEDSEVLFQLEEFMIDTVGSQPENFGVAYYYPDRKTLIHGVGPELDIILRTASNRGLIDAKEQEKLRQFNVCFLGLSVGSSGLRTWQREADSNRLTGGDPTI